MIKNSKQNRIFKSLTIAGFDSFGGAGLQADLKTFAAHDVYGFSVLTALPIQNSQGVTNFYEINLNAIQEQFESVFNDDMPDSIKIGMLFNSSIIELISSLLIKYAKNIPIILDPVMVAKSGDRLLDASAINTLKSKLLPIVDIVTPNTDEVFELVNIKIIKSNRENLLKQMHNAASAILQLGSKAILLKGGHIDTDVVYDFYLDQTGFSKTLESPRVYSQNTHGTGCTMSSAIAANIAKNMPKIQACQFAKDYIYKAIQAGKNDNIGKGCGPVRHFFN